MDFEFLSVIVFFGVIILLAIKDRKNIEFSYGIFIRRTKKGRKWIEQLAKKYSKQLNVFANIAVILAIVFSILGFVYLLRLPGVKFLFPDVIPGEADKGLSEVAFFIPLWYWIIAVCVIIVPHELAHGLVSIIEKIKISSLGVALFLIFPGAFVEPDEIKFKKSKPKTRMRIAAVGSIANLAVLIFLFLLVVFWGFLGSIAFEGTGVSFENTIPDTPAHEIEMKGTITKINDERVGNILDLSKILDNTKPGDEVSVVTTEGKYKFELGENPDNSSQAFRGSGNVSTEFKYRQGFIFLGDISVGLNVYQWFANLFNWVAFLDLNVAIANLLPFLPFDGGVIWQALFEKITKRKKFAKRMIIVLSVITYSLLVMNLIGVDRILGFLRLG